MIDGVKTILDIGENVVFSSPEVVGLRDWGDEILLGVIPNVLSLKKINMKQGASGGFQYHRKKNEIAVLISGRLLIEFLGDGCTIVQKIIEPGAVFYFPPFFAHKATALEDSVYIEASNPIFNDRVRIDAQLGLEEIGLPSTKEVDIYER